MELILLYRGVLKSDLYFLYKINRAVILFYELFYILIINIIFIFNFYFI